MSGLQHEKRSQACVCVDTLLKVIQSVEAIATDMPILVVWNMNCGQPKDCQGERSWKPKVEAIKSILTAHPTIAAALIVHKKSCHGSREQFRNKDATVFEQNGVSLGTEVALHFRHSDARQNRTSVYTGWLASSQTANESSHAFAKSSLVTGSITDLPAAALRDMVVPSDSLRANNHLSSAKREAFFVCQVRMRRCTVWR